MGIFKKKFLLFTLLLSSALANGWADEDNEHDSVREEEPTTPYEWEYFPLEYHPSVTDFQKNLGLLDKFPNIDACVHDRVAGDQRKYWYAPAFIDMDLAGSYFFVLIGAPALLILLPLLFKCILSERILRTISGEKYDSAFVGSLYLAWYSAILFSLAATIYLIAGRFRIEIVWCFDSPHTYRDHPTSMKTVIDIPVMDSEDILDYGLTISEGFMNTVYSPAEYESRSEVDRCTTENMGTFTRLTCTFEDIVSFDQDVVEHLYFKFNKEQVNMQEFGNAKIIMLNKFGYDGMEDPEKREQMVYYERYEMLKEGIDIPMDMASRMKVKLIPTQYQNNIRDFHYTENKQHLVSLRPNVSEDEEEEDEQIHFEFEFDVDKKVMRYESRSLLVTITQAMSLLTGMIFFGFLYIDLLKKWKLGEW